MDKLDGLLLKFVEYLKVNGFAERTVVGYKHEVKSFLDYLRGLEIENIIEADRRVLMSYQTHVYMQTYHGKPLAPNTRMNRLAAVRTFYRYLLKHNHVSYDPTNAITMPKCPDQLPRNILSKKEIGKLLSAPNLETPLGVRDRAILEVFYSTGIRTSELANLTIQDIDLHHGELRVNLGKNAKDRIVPLGEVACAFLELYLNESRPKLANGNPTLLFVTKNGKKLKRVAVSVLVKKYCEEAGIKTVTPHSIRHSVATHLLKGKADIRHIQQLLGHALISTTQRYTRVEITDLKQVMRRCHPRENKEIDAREV